MNVNCLRINIKDNVVTLIKNVASGDALLGVNVPEGIFSLNDIQLGHKVAIETIRSGDQVIKYGEVIGYAFLNIMSGEHVHVHNIASGRGRGDLE